MSNEMLTLRMNILGGMNAYILDKVEDKDYILRWSEDGVSKDATEDDLRAIAKDEKLWLKAIQCFARCTNY